jgi:queuine/archaeosine tRNA-ribosyltransferase
MAEVCVFYDGNDRKAVRELVKLIERHYSVWWDQKAAAGLWPEQVESALSDALVTVVVWSKSSVKNEIVRAEASLAIRRKKPLLMLRIEEVEVPLQFSQRSSTDVYSFGSAKECPELQEFLQKIDQAIKPSDPGARPESLLLGSKQLRLPAFFRSVSSFETQIPPYACLEILELHETDLVLTSAYDLIDIRPKARSFEIIRRMQARGAVVVMDSGNYEAYRRKDFESEENPEGWGHEKYAKAIKEAPFDLAFCFDNFKTGSKPKSVVSDVISRTRRDQDLSAAGVICPIVHAPTERDGKRVASHLPEIMYEVCRELRPPVIAVPERELGEGILERARSVHEIRKALRSLPWYQPVHLLGTGNLWSIALLSRAGADLFDGLEWCRTVASDENGQLFHFQHYDLFRYQARLAASDVTRKSVDNATIPYAVKVAFHNLEVINNWMRRLQTYSERGPANTFLAQKLGEQFSDLRDGLPEIFG